MFTPSTYTKQAVVGGKVLSVCDYESISERKEILLNDSQAAVEYKNGDISTILPVRSTSGINMDRPGIYLNNSPIHFLSFPKTDEEVEEYCPDSSKITDFGKITDMQAMIDERQKIETATNIMLESSDNKTIPPLRETDSPTMRALKEAIIAKDMDIDMYKERFGVNFPNDKRKINDDDITLFILERFCECLDMECDIVIRDAKGNIANPMGKLITANIVPGNANNVTIESVNETEESNNE